MRAVHRKSFRKIATVFIVLSATLGSSSHAEAGLLGPSSDYIVRITPATQVAVESAIKNAGGTVNQRFQYAMNGFVIKLPDILIPVLKKIPNVLTVEKDAPVSGLDIQQNETPTPSWGLDRIDQRAAQHDVRPDGGVLRAHVHDADNGHGPVEDAAREPQRRVGPCGGLCAGQ